MGALADYITEVKAEHYAYKQGKLTQKELDTRLQKIAKAHDRKMFRFYQEEEEIYS